jgi:uncharacterized membrane protein
MANSKSKARARAQQQARAQAKKTVARTAPPVRATPTSPAARIARSAATTAAAPPEPEAEADAELDAGPDGEEVPSGPPLWFQITTTVLALLGLGISAYETYAHFHGSKLLGCPTGTGTWNCSAVITSSQSMVFGVIPVAILGLAFYVAAVPLFSPWGWRLRRREVGLVRLASAVLGMGFVMYLIYAEVYQIGQVCEYCTGVHIVTFLLFCMTVFAVAFWGVGERAKRAS